ncbi:MAG: SDR family oxidoreductase [Myxococcales bacterium]|nr:SDR family oxidoreductase [Myxococcales bacterium]
MKVVITGISGALARLVTRGLVEKGYQIKGIDRRPWPDAPKGVEIVQADIRKRPAEDVFRTWKPDALIHMATVTHFSVDSEERYRINLGGTRAIFDHCAAYGVKQAIFVGRHTVYGAAPDAPLYRTEAEPPLAVATFPDRADLVAADLFAGSALWRWPKIDTAVLRIVYTLGPTRRGTLANFISGPRVPMVMGFDPLFQFMHEQDAAGAIIASLETKARGVFNVAGPAPVPLSVLCKATGRKPIPIPEPLFGMVLGRFGFPALPPGAIHHIKHPIVVDGEEFRTATGWTYQYDEVQVMEGFRWT